MNSSLMEKKLTEDNFSEYIDKIINIFRLSNKQSSILFDLKIKDYKSIIKLSIINQNGEREEFEDVILRCDQLFYQSFLIPLVEKINSIVKIEVRDVVNLSNQDLVTFRMITNNNDLFTIDGLSMDDANHLLRLSNKEKSMNDKKLNVSNNEGTGSILAFLLMIGVLVITFILIVLFIG